MTSPKIICGLSAIEAYTSTNLSGNVQIGTQTTHSVTDATVVYGIKVTAAANANVATLTFTSGAVAQTTGSPTILGSAVDFEGNALPTMTKVHGIRIRTSGSGTVTLAGSATAMLDSMVLTSGSDIVQKFPSGLTSPGTLAMTFSATGGIAEIEVLAE